MADKSKSILVLVWFDTGREYVRWVKEISKARLLVESAKALGFKCGYDTGSFEGRTMSPDSDVRFVYKKLRAAGYTLHA